MSNPFERKSGGGEIRTQQPSLGNTGGFRPVKRRYRLPGDDEAERGTSLSPSHIRRLEAPPPGTERYVPPGKGGDDA